LALTITDLEVHGQHAEGDHYRSQNNFNAMIRLLGINSNSTAPFTQPLPAGQDLSQADMDTRRADFTRRLMKKLRNLNGIYSARNFRQMLHSMDLNSDGIISAHSVEGALTQNGIRLPPAERKLLKELFSAEFTGNKEEATRQPWFMAEPEEPKEDSIDYVLLLAHGYRNWSERREEAVREAYDLLCSKCPSGILVTKALMTHLKEWVLTPSLSPDLPPTDDAQNNEHAAAAFLRQWRETVASSDGTMTLDEFKYHYLDLSACIPSESEFIAFVLKSWGEDPDDWLAKKAFRHFCHEEEDGEEDVLSLENFMKLLQVFDSKISEEEAQAWYVAMDEDQSGEVSLGEFINCKVLKAKRLYDEYVASPDRCATKEEMVVILQSLCPDISTEDATMLYHYADLDGNGDVSFAEFLENQLLKLLQVYQETRGTSTRKNFSEEEIEKVMKKLDPGLDPAEIQAIYKAVDTDGSGSVSFVEFCQSQVIRAKTLFDRFDLDRSRSLTQIKFIELLRFFDNTWTAEEEKAICDLVINPTSQKVSLSAFLNPNIIKLKLLFNKYDKDGGKELDRDEFKVMLRELFTAEEKDVEELIGFMFEQRNDETISFLEYVENFKELNKRNDAMVLAKKRKAREKAKSKGLLFKHSD